MIDVLGQSIPPDTAHAVSVSFPTWKSNVGYEEGQDWVLSKMETGYPRFFIHKSIERLAEDIVARFGAVNEKAMLFPSKVVADRCVSFFRTKAPELASSRVRRVDLTPSVHSDDYQHMQKLVPELSCVLYPKDAFPIAKQVWQHAGDGISSRRAEFCQKAFDDGLIGVHDNESVRPRSPRVSKGPRRYQKSASMNGVDAAAVGDGRDSAPQPTNEAAEGREYLQFIEERFGRNLDVDLAINAKLAIRRRIAGSLTANVELEEAMDPSNKNEPNRRMEGFSEDDVYLYPSGMSSIFNTHQTLMAARGPGKSVCFGFPYIDTLKILEKWGPGCLFYGHGSGADLDDLQRRLEGGERFLAFFCEFPGNPLLKSPDLKRIRLLSERYDFALVVDETIGNFMNIHVLPDVDVAVSSLTKVFSGDSNVMGGSAVLNPKGRYYSLLKETLAAEYEDNYWIEDALFMERNSRDFVSRIDRINSNAETICTVLNASPYVKSVHYPKYSPTRAFYDQYRNTNGGYGGLLSCTFHSTADAVAFYDALDTAKGPSLGTNFTLSSPYSILAHFNELDWAASFGVEADLVRVSVGLEASEELKSIFQRALDAVGETRA